MHGSASPGGPRMRPSVGCVIVLGADDFMPDLITSWGSAPHLAGGRTSLRRNEHTDFGLSVRSPFSVVVSRRCSDLRVESAPSSCWSRSPEWGAPRGGIALAVWHTLWVVRPVSRRTRHAVHDVLPGLVRGFGGLAPLDLPALKAVSGTHRSPPPTATYTTSDRP